MPKYEALPESLSAQMAHENENRNFIPTGFDDAFAIRRNPQSQPPHTAVWYPNFTRDVDKILHCPYYNRYTDKTQVFALFKNDDLTRRSLHVQLVSRIARTLGRALHLNLDLIEAIALGHDIGHTPFAHAGEVFLDQVYYRNAGRHFSHNIHSVRVLDQIFPMNLSLQVLCGIAGHNGEIELEEYRPLPVDTFTEFDRMIEECYLHKASANRFQPNTLEGNVVRIADIIAYLGKDRQDAARIHVVAESAFRNNGKIGTVNAEIIHNLLVNIIENSYGKPYIKLDKAHFDALKAAKEENYAMIYLSAANPSLNEDLRPMMSNIYGQLLEDLLQEKKNSPIFTHHIDYVNLTHPERDVPYEKTEPNQMVVDYIASMTDDYFIDLHEYLFPNSPHKVIYRGYFD